MLKFQRLDVDLKEIKMSLEQEKLKLSYSWDELRLRKYGVEAWSCFKFKLYLWKLLNIWSEMRLNFCDWNRSYSWSKLRL